MMNWLTELLKDFPALSVAKERLALIEARLEKAEADKAALEKEVAELREQNAKLRDKIVALTKTNTFEEQDGVLWRREPDGTVRPIAYCPACQLPMHDERGLKYQDNKVVCSRCSFKAPFHPYRVEQIAAEMSKKQPTAS